MTNSDYAEIDAALESVYAAMEAHTIDTETRNSLPDDCFGIIKTDEKGNKKRIYPLKVPNNKAKTEELLQKSVQMFHYAKTEDRKDLAKAIMAMIQKEHIRMTIGKRNQIFRYLEPSEVASCVTIVEKE